MTPMPEVTPLSYRHRNAFFYILAFVFFASLPFLFLYAAGYRFHFGEKTELVSTGGLYVSADRTGAEIYIDDELVRETRVFRTAFYAQSLVPGTHKVHVQKKDHHTWVKELPVYAHLVTEAQAFNLPLVPEVRIITAWKNKDEAMVLSATTSVMKTASSTTGYVIDKNTATTTLVANAEYDEISFYFKQDTVLKQSSVENFFSGSLGGESNSATTTVVSTTTKETSRVRIYEDKGEVYAKYIGRRDGMPYYYCADDFPALEEDVNKATSSQVAAVVEAKNESLSDPLLTIDENVACDQTIKIDRLGEDYSYFDFFPGSEDFVMMVLDSGVYMIEIDDRSWQNAQPILLGKNLQARVVNGRIYVYDGEVIYQVELEV